MRASRVRILQRGKKARKGLRGDSCAEGSEVPGPCERTAGRPDLLQSIGEACGENGASAKSRGRTAAMRGTAGPQVPGGRAACA